MTPSGGKRRQYTADEALARLSAGNARFLAGKARFPTVRKEVLAALARQQRPYATIIGCSDSRVPPELVFDAGFGELFIIRVAGNVISLEVLGSVQYAALHLRTPLFVVLGHQGCGAVQAALATKRSVKREASRIARLLENILPGLASVDGSLSDLAALDAAVEANVRWSMHQILETPEAKARKAEGALKLVGAIYELKTGKVRFLE
ncbi:MAG: carbonic anhydrase [Acidobacteria bacterium]|nr:MAG: carbonic anhydrase [Acidobacteriota bacterium]PYR50419.1 MAG: carbonic anhydrase [Acidobacteriota bacterium]